MNFYIIFHFFFFFNDTATTEIYTLSLLDALPIYIDVACEGERHDQGRRHEEVRFDQRMNTRTSSRSEEHTSELQSQSNLVCRLLLEKKKKKKKNHIKLKINTKNIKKLLTIT